MDATTILDGSDMQKARTAAEFIAWVEQKLSELSATAEAKAFARSGAMSAKKFYDEIFPLARFAAHEYVGRNDVLIRPNLGNENFDAHVTLGGGREGRNVFLEITYAKDGYDTSLRMEVLAKEGHVWLTGPVTRSGRRGSPNRRVSVEPYAADHSETLENYFRLIEKRLRAKSGVRYGDNYTLLVAVDDYFPLSQDSDWPRLRVFAEALLPTLALDFARVVFVGIAGRLFLSLNVNVLADEDSAR